MGITLDVEGACGVIDNGYSGEWCGSVAGDIDTGYNDIRLLLALLCNPDEELYVDIIRGDASDGGLGISSS
jgi:hypothetical protein